VQLPGEAVPEGERMRFVPVEADAPVVTVRHHVQPQTQQTFLLGQPPLVQPRRIIECPLLSVPLLMSVLLAGENVKTVEVVLWSISVIVLHHHQLVVGLHALMEPA
jgi:hypothetical protein